MVSSRHRSSIASTTTTTTTTAIAATAASASASTTSSNTASDSPSTRVQKPVLEDWTVKEKLCLASLAMKHNNAWSTVARNMQTFAADRDKQDGRYNQKTCAAQFDKLMNELGVDKRPKRNEPADASSSVISKMTEKRIKELEDNLTELRKSWLGLCDDLKVLEEQSTNQEKPEPSASTKGKSKQTSTPTSKIPSKANTSTGGDVEKPPTRALTRRESSRKNLEKTLSTLYRETVECKGMSQLIRPTPETEKTLGNYDKLVLKHVNLSSIESKIESVVDDPYAVMNDLLLLFQNATMYYPIDHQNYKIAVDLREKLVPQWERSLLDKAKSRH